MKRKRRSVKRNTVTKKPSVAADAPVDPRFYSDVDKDNDELPVTKEIETRETSTNKSGQCLVPNKAVVDNVIPGSASAKLARALSSSRTNAPTNTVLLQRPTIGQKEPKSSRSAPLYNEQELEAADSVIKKIMKMDAAMPFNAPVDPIALGIPDYYDIITTPMDFGTICSKIERGIEYKNSEDVFKDVRLIWDNCAKYNKKGSYILELMKRVKANFMKHWTAAGLYKEQQTISKEHLPHGHNTQPFADSAMRHEDVPMSPVSSTIRESAYLPPHYNSPYMNQGQHHQQFPPYYSAYNPQHMPYQYPSSMRPVPHHHDMVPQHGYPSHMPPQHNHFPHLPPMDPINPNPYHPQANEASASQMHSHQPSPSGSVMFNPHQRPYMHPLSLSHLPPHLHPDINSLGTGHMHLPHREPTSTFNQQEHQYHLPQHAGDRTHPQHYQMDSVLPPPPYHHLSTSHAPPTQLNQSTYHHSSHAEGGRNIERSGNLPTPPPVESTVNYTTKRGTERPGPTLIGNTSYHQPDKINSMPEQSSSMNNLEACNLPEHSDKNEQESSPSEKLHSTAVSNISKRNGQVLELQNFQEQSSPNTNREEHTSVENTPQNKIVPIHSQALPLRAYNSTTGKKKYRGRGPAKCMFMEIERIKVNTDDYGEPVGPETQKLASFLGTLARNGNFLPLTYHDWRAVPIEYKESIWEKVQLGFDVDPRSKDWVLHSLSLRWKNWKSFLKTSRYDTHETDEERLADRDERVLPEQWAALVALWGTEAAQRRSEKNKASRAKMKFNHVTGRKSFARIREEQKAKSDGKELSRAELFILTRTRKDGKPVNAETSEVIEKLKEREQVLEDTPEESKKKPDDILTEIIGPNKRGLSRCVELGVSMKGPVKPSRSEAIKMATQANTEIHEMKEKMAFMELTCAQMASQMAAMMSMMSSMNKNVPNKEEPDMVPITYATSTQSTPHRVNATPSPTPEPTPQVPATSGTSDQSTPQQEKPPLDTMSQVLIKSGTSDQSMPHEENTMSPLPDPLPQVRPRGRPRKSRI